VTLSATLAAVLANARYADLAAETREHARRAVLDWLGSALAGSLEPPARMAQTVAQSLGASGDATVFSAGRSSAAGAAFANGVASHILELDDVHKGSTLHAAAPVIPAALAVAERERADGKAFLLAVVAGYEAALRIGEAVNPSHYRFWHPTGTAATFGAAAAAGTVMQMDAATMTSAFGSAGTQAAGLWEFNADGTMSKHLHPGKAAFNGVLSADLARSGFTGPATILEGDRGFFRAMSTSADASRISDGLGTTWKIAENCYKVWSCCGHTHSAIDIATQVRNATGWTRREAVDAIESIEIRTYGPGHEIVKEMNPRTPYQAKFSLAYTVAAAILYGHVSLDVFAAGQFGSSGVTSSDVAALLSRTRVLVDDDLTAKYPGAWPARLRVKLKDGRELLGSADFPVGNPENPVSTAQLERKFADLVSPRFGDAVTSRAIEAVHTLDDVRDMATAFSTLIS
jgi:2-methylcitrate dehydratase PrpD